MFLGDMLVYFLVTLKQTCIGGQPFLHLFSSWLTESPLYAMYILTLLHPPLNNGCQICGFLSSSYSVVGVFCYWGHREGDLLWKTWIICSGCCLPDCNGRFSNTPLVLNKTWRCRRGALGSRHSGDMAGQGQGGRTWWIWVWWKH